MKILNRTAPHSMMVRRPNFSIVNGVSHVPMQEKVFITAARREDRNGESPTWLKMMVL